MFCTKRSLYFVNVLRLSSLGALGRVVVNTQYVPLWVLCLELSKFIYTEFIAEWGRGGKLLLQGFVAIQGLWSKMRKCIKTFMKRH